MYLKFLLGICLVIITSANVTSQAKKFGEISSFDFSNYPSEYDSTESAVVLFDVGYSYFTYPGYDCFIERHVRIKVINDEGLDEGDISLLYNRDLDQSIDRIKAIVYKLKDGEIEKTELHKDQIFEENLFNDLKVKKFVVPALSKGSIFEYSYKKRVGSAFYLPDWKFHRDIPVQFSQYEMKIPNNFLYQTVLKGVDTVLVSNIDEYIDHLGGGRTITLSKFDIPPVNDIPFINSVEDFKTEVYNQLVYVNFTGSPSRRFNNTWEKVAGEIRDHSAIGKQRLNGEMKKAVDVVIDGMEDPLEKTKAIYAFVADRISWNGLHFLISEQGIRDTFENNEGNSADINLMLHEMLKHAGINAHFAFISTKDHGEVITNYPIIQQFNHIVVIVELNEQKFLLDATEGERALEMPPIKDLYRNVFMVKEDSFSWLRSAPSIKSSKALLITHKIDQRGIVEADISGNFSGYYREEIRSEKEISKLVNKNYELEIDSVDVKNFDNVDEGITFSINGTYENNDIKESNELVYLQPFSLVAFPSNPFKASKRLFPIYFPFKFKQRIVVNVEFPQMYKVEEIPQSNQFMIGENEIRVRFLSQSSARKVTMLIDFSVSEIEFYADDYDNIKKLFNSFEESQNQQIVLRKNAE